ncbi:MAG TPA: decaprenyl-phosphate phosphoribosyltransferase [Actinomycetes bacterium]|nr:decaprenyl-phosphate phosphoribosyltransferase [Actinomycetes bacterium]
MTDGPRAPSASPEAAIGTVPLPAGSVGALAMALVRSLRPRQWAKNVLVLAAPAAGGALVVPAVIADAVVAVVAFCLVSSATYLMNDLADRDGDRRHPLKAARPIAAGLVSPALAGTAGLALLVAGLAVGSRAGLGLAAVLAVYLAVNVAYCLHLRRVAVVDLAAVASGFVLRVLAGGVATGVPVSRWLLIVASFGALFVVAGKRYGELLDHPEAADPGRATLAVYTPAYLRFVTALASAVMIIAYCLWAFTAGMAYHGMAELSVLPLALVVLRYGLLLETGQGGAPEEVFLRDRPLQALGVAWALIYGTGVYLGG